VKDMKENYVDRFDRLERINRENFHALQADMRRLFDRLDSVMTKEDHDRICRWPQGPPFNNNPQGR
jgi:hypothetical protein